MRKVAFETALAVSYAGGRAAVSMKQVGLNVACDPLMSSAYTGVQGRFVVICADDPGPPQLPDRAGQPDDGHDGQEFRSWIPPPPGSQGDDANRLSDLRGV